MKTILYNDLEFSIERADNGWVIERRLPNGAAAVVAAGLFADLPDAEAQARAQQLVRSIFPAGIRLVAPDVAHPNLVGDLKIVGPDVSHPNFIYWSEDSTSFAR